MRTALAGEGRFLTVLTVGGGEVCQSGVDEGPAFAVADGGVEGGFGPGGDVGAV